MKTKIKAKAEWFELIEFSKYFGWQSFQGLMNRALEFLKSEREQLTRCYDDRLEEMREFYERKLKHQKESYESVIMQLNTENKRLIEQNQTLFTSNSPNITLDAQPQYVNEAKEDCFLIDSDKSELFDQAVQARASNNFEYAFHLFEKASRLGCPKAMGALARAYFKGEGVEKSPVIGFAWLLCSAELGFSPAIERSQSLSEKWPDLRDRAEDKKSILMKDFSHLIAAA
ncbi:tetratricopeptide repeat protein [Algicola sagamiensis]|uniref:tetratricopeptide repeat protein n=1 Tax=Algicola sagamiensis TaxID=163869 RepID=UPI00036D545E|nr:SEL1-like repeat protein [Algicola sagamiensis]